MKSVFTKVIAGFLVFIMVCGIVPAFNLNLNVKAKAASVARQAKPSTPKLSKVTNTQSGVNFTWKKAAGAHEYVIYRKTKNSGWKCLGLTSLTSFSDVTVSNGTVYYYTVRARNDAGDSGYVKSGISIKYIATPKLTKISNTTTGVSVSWSKVGGADGYYVYRKLSGASKWSKIATVKKSSTTSFKDKTVKSGKTYVYTVKAYDGKIASGHHSGGIKILYLTSPKVSSTKNISTGVKITWNKIPGAKGYTVYRKTSKSSWKQVGSTTSNSSVSFTDTKYTNNATYTYTVRAYNGSYKSSYRTLDKAKIKATIKGDITSSNVKSKFLPILKNIATVENRYYKTAGFVTNADGTWKSYYGMVPTPLPDEAVSNVFKFKSVNTVEELAEFFSKYMSYRYMLDNHFYDEYALFEYNGGLYVMTGAVGTISYDVNSIKLVGRYATGYYISADLYSSGDTYCGTVTFYVKKDGSKYVVDKVVSEKQLHDWSYRSPNYSPVW